MMGSYYSWLKSISLAPSRSFFIPVTVGSVCLWKEQMHHKKKDIIKLKYLRDSTFCRSWGCFSCLKYVWMIITSVCCDSIMWWVWLQRGGVVGGGRGQLEGWVHVWTPRIEEEEVISWWSHLPILSVGASAPPSVPTSRSSFETESFKTPEQIKWKHKYKPLEIRSPFLIQPKWRGD